MGAKKAKKKKKKKAKKKKKRKKAKKKKKTRKEGGRKSAKSKAAGKASAARMKKAGKGLYAPKTLSKELGAICGGTRMSRLDAVKKLWAYIKAKKLNHGRTIKPDGALAKVVGAGAINMFKMT